MLISRPVPTGRRVELSIIDFCVRTFIDVRCIGSSFTIYVVDDVPDTEVPDPYHLYERTFSENFSRFLRRGNGFSDVINRLWERWYAFYGPLTPLLLYEKVSDIYIDSSSIRAYHVDLGLCDVSFDFPRCHRPSRSFIRRHRCSISYKLDDFVKYLIYRVSERTSNPVTAYMPMASVTDTEFRVRFSLSVRPISDPYIHVRILPRRPWTFGELIVRGSLSVDDAALLWYMFDKKVPILIIGPMGGGKTSLANAVTFCSNPMLFKALIMDVDEITLPGHNVVKLFERRAYGLGVRAISKRDLIAHALRIGADYIIVNEVRARDEIAAWIDAVTSGHGGVTTFHAENMEKLRIRLENMIGSSKIVKEIAVVKMDVSTSIEEVENVRSSKKIRKISKIYIPENLNIDIEELESRKHIVRELVGKSYTQQLNILSEAYRSPEVMIAGAGGGI